MEIPFKNLTVSMLVGTALSTVMIAPPTALPAVNTYGDELNRVELQASAQVQIPRAYKKDSLDTWINKLAYLESNGRTDIKILDHNGRYSYGCLQFQMGTFIAYGKRYGIITGEEDNLESLIMSCDLQKRITKRMILEDSSNWEHWFTSVMVKGLGLPPRDIAQR